jgi:uncharacterized membrane protein
MVEPRGDHAGSDPIFCLGFQITYYRRMVVLKSKKLWLYPVTASVLLLAHLQWALYRGNGFSPVERQVLRAVDVCIILAHPCGQLVLAEMEQRLSRCSKSSELNDWAPTNGNREK